MSVLNKKLFEEVKDIKINFYSANQGNFHFKGKFNKQTIEAIVSADNVCNIDFNINESILNLSEFYISQILVNNEVIFDNN